MDKKTLALIDGIVGLAGGILLLFGIWIAITGSFGNALVVIIKLALLALGILSLVTFKDMPEMSKAPSILLVVAGGISLIPLLGWVGGIIAIIGGGLFLAKLKLFNQD